MSTRIAIIDNDSMFCMGLSVIIEKQSCTEFAGALKNRETAFHQIRQLSPDIVFTFIDMFHLRSIHLTQQITSGLPGIKVIALLAHFNEYFISRLVKSVNVSGYLLKSSSTEDIMTAIHAVKKNEFHLGAEIEKSIFKAKSVNSCNNVDSICNMAAPELVGDDKKVILELQRMFIDKAPRLLESLKKAIDANDTVLTGDHAYSLRVASSIIGASSLRENASIMEVLARNSSVNNMYMFYKDLEYAFNRTIEELEIKQCQNSLE